MRNLVGAGSALAMALLGVSGPANPAHADTAFKDAPPDTGSHTWCVINNPAVVLHQTAYDATLGMRDQTVVKRGYDSPCGPNTDTAWVWNPYLQGNDYGTTYCTAWYPNGRCNTYLITLYRKIIDRAPYPDSQLRKTACHELGHSLGVSHYYDSNLPGADTSHSCMRSEHVPTPDKSWHTSYGKHHITKHINPWFS